MSRPIIFTVEVTKHPVEYGESYEIGTVDFVSSEEAEKYIASLPDNETAELWVHPEIEGLDGLF